jgi:autotransporter-associated beta strand protein
MINLSTTGGSDATISTVAGMSRYLGDGGASANASLNCPSGVAIDSRGNLFIADTYNNAVREVNASTGLITTVAGNGICGYSGDGGAATSAELDAPMGVAVDAAGDVFIADTSNDVIREVNHTTGTITTVAGNGSDGYSGDGYAATSAQLNFPNTVAVDSAGNLFIADSGNNVIRKVNLSTGVIATVAGDFALGSGYSGDGGAATGAQLSYPAGIAVDAVGELFIADSGNNVIRKVNLSTGVIVTVAGDFALGSGYRGDGGAATGAQLSYPAGVAVDAAGDLFIADSGNSAIREVNASTGTIATVAGNGIGGYSGDGGSATQAQLSDPTAVAADAAGDLYIADSMHNAIREVDLSTNRITTFAGNKAGSYSGDGGAATSAELYDSLGVAADTTGNLFVADSNNNVVREVDLSTGVISTVAGNGTWGYSGDGDAATAAQFNDPMGVAVDAAGDLFIADSGNNVVRKVDLSTGVISTVAGTAAAGYSGDGAAATAAQLYNPVGIAVSKAGDLFIADSGNNVIRKIVPLLYWDPNQTGTEDSGGCGAWTTDGNDKSWYDPFLGEDVAWSDGSNAIFSGAAGTVTLSGTVSPASISFASDGYLVVNAAASDSLSVPPSGASINVAAGSATIDAPIAGSDRLAVTGSGTLVLGGANTDSGGTDIEENATVQVAAPSALGQGSLTIDGTLDLNGQSITVNLLNSSTYDGLITNSSTTASTLTLEQDSNSAYYGDILDGNGGVCLVLCGNGVLVDEGNNGYSGGTTISSGIFVVTSAGGLPSGMDLTVGAGAASLFGTGGSPSSPSDSGNALYSRSGLGAYRGGGLGANLPVATNPVTDPPVVADTAPTVTAIQCVGQTFVDADSVDFAVTFSKSVTGVAPGDFEVDGFGGSVTSISGNGCQYTVTVSDIPDSSGALGLEIVAGSGILDWFGSPLAAAIPPVDQHITSTDSFIGTHRTAPARWAAPVPGIRAAIGTSAVRRGPCKAGSMGATFSLPARPGRFPLATPWPSLPSPSSRTAMFWKATR